MYDFNNYDNDIAYDYDNYVECNEEENYAEEEYTYEKYQEQMIEQLIDSIREDI